MNGAPPPWGFRCSDYRSALSCAFWGMWQTRGTSNQHAVARQRFTQTLKSHHCRWESWYQLKTVCLTWGPLLTVALVIDAVTAQKHSAQLLAPHIQLRPFKSRARPRNHSPSNGTMGSTQGSFYNLVQGNFETQISLGAKIRLLIIFLSHRDHSEMWRETFQNLMLIS